MQSAPITLYKLIANIEKMILNPLIILLFALALAYFLYGVFQFISKSQEEEGKVDGRRHIMWGLIGMFIMVAVFWIMNLIINTLGIKYFKQGSHQPQVIDGTFKTQVPN